MHARYIPVVDAGDLFERRAAREHVLHGGRERHSGPASHAGRDLLQLVGVLEHAFERYRKLHGSGGAVEEHQVGVGLIGGVREHTVGVNGADLVTHVDVLHIRCLDRLQPRDVVVGLRKRIHPVRVVEVRGERGGVRVFRDAEFRLRRAIRQRVIHGNG